MWYKRNIYRKKSGRTVIESLIMFFLVYIVILEFNLKYEIVKIKLYELLKEISLRNGLFWLLGYYW